MRKLIAKFCREESGAAMVEYTILLGIITVSVIAAVVFMRNQVSDKFDYAGSKISATPNG